METIYSRYRTGSPSFEMTLRLMQELLTARLTPEYRKIWVEGCNAGRAKLVFTIFENGHTSPIRPYRMEFVTIPSMRQYRPVPISDIPEDIARYETEVRLMTEMIDRLRTGPLAGVIS